MATLNDIINSGNTDNTDTTSGGNAPIYDASTQAPTSGGNAPVGPGGGLLNSLTSSLGQFLGINDPTSQAMLIPYLSQAMQLWNDSDQANSVAQSAAQTANPFGQYRQYYGNMLQQLEENPAAIAQTPGYQFAMNQALDQAGSKLRAAGYGGSSQMQQGLADTASGLAQQTYNNTINQLSNLAGAQFNPASSANILMQGMNESLAGKNAALSALMAPWTRNATSGNVTNGSTNPGGNGGVTSSGLSSLTNYLTSLGNSSGNEFNSNYNGPATDLFGNSTSGADNTFTSYDNNGNALDQYGGTVDYGMGGGE